MKQLRWIPFLAAGLVPMIACGPTIGVGTPSGAGGTAPAAGGTIVSTGGSLVGAGGFVSSTGGVLTSTGGVVASTGGVVSSTGGVVSSTGGVASSTGGTTGGAIECTGTAFTPTEGGFDNGTFCGYAFSYAFDDGGTVVPEGSLSDVPTGLCVDGEIPAADPLYPGIAIGVSLKETPDGKGTYTAAGSGITVKYSKGGGTKFQANVVAANGKAYCAPLGGTGTDSLSWSDFTVECWTAGGAALSAGTELEEFHLQFQADTAAQTITQGCLTDLQEN